MGTFIREERNLVLEGRAVFAPEDYNVPKKILDLADCSLRASRDVYANSALAGSPCVDSREGIYSMMLLTLQQLHWTVLCCFFFFRVLRWLRYRRDSLNLTMINHIRAS